MQISTIFVPVYGDREGQFNSRSFVIATHINSREHDENVVATRSFCWDNTSLCRGYVVRSHGLEILCWGNNILFSLPQLLGPIIHCAMWRQARRRCFFASFSLTQLSFSRPAPHCLNSKCICICVPMGVLVWKRGVFRYIIGALLFWALKTVPLTN